MLASTGPTKTKSGSQALANFDLDEDVRDKARARAAELLAANPLYPQVGML